MSDGQKYAHILTLLLNAYNSMWFRKIGRFPFSDRTLLHDRPFSLSTPFLLFGLPNMDFLLCHSYHTIEQWMICCVMYGSMLQIITFQQNKAERGKIQKKWPTKYIRCRQCGGCLHEKGKTIEYLVHCAWIHAHVGGRKWNSTVKILKRMRKTNWLWVENRWHPIHSRILFVFIWKWNVVHTRFETTILHFGRYKCTYIGYCIPCIIRHHFIFRQLCNCDTAHGHEYAILLHLYGVYRVGRSATRSFIVLVLHRFVFVCGGVRSRSWNNV